MSMTRSPLGLGHLREVLALDDARGVDEKVDPPELRYDLFHDRLDVGGLGDVELDREGPSSHCLYFLGRGVDAFLIDVRDRYVGPVSGEPEGYAFSDSGTGAAHEGEFFL